VLKFAVSHCSVAGGSFVSLKVSLLFNIILEHIEGFVLSLYEFKNSTAVETRLLHLQPFMNISLHLLIIVELVTSQVLPQQCKVLVI
jgi:hypothetical protein